MAAKIIGQLIGIAIGSLVGALFIQFATERVCKFRPSYGTSYKAYFTASIIGYACSLGLAFAFYEANKIAYLFLAVGISFFIGSMVYGKLIQNPASGPIGFSKGCLISLVLLLIGIAILGLIVLIAKRFLGY